MPPASPAHASLASPRSRASRIRWPGPRPRRPTRSLRPSAPPCDHPFEKLSRLAARGGPLYHLPSPESSADPRRGRIPAWHLNRFGARALRVEPGADGASRSSVAQPASSNLRPWRPDDPLATSAEVDHAERGSTRSERSPSRNGASRAGFGGPVPPARAPPGGMAAPVLVEPPRGVKPRATRGWGRGWHPRPDRWRGVPTHPHAVGAHRRERRPLRRDRG